MFSSFFFFTSVQVYSKSGFLLMFLFYVPVNSSHISQPHESHLSNLSHLIHQMTQEQIFKEHATAAGSASIVV